MPISGPNRECAQSPPAQVPPGQHPHPSRTLTLFIEGDRPAVDDELRELQGDLLPPLHHLPLGELGTHSLSPRPPWARPPAPSRPSCPQPHPRNCPEDTHTPDFRGWGPHTTCAPVTCSPHSELGLPWALTALGTWVQSSGSPGPSLQPWPRSLTPHPAVLLSQHNHPPATARLQPQHTPH